MTGTALVLRADARRLPIADNTVDLCISSPPYWSLRSYTDGGEHYSGQIGGEPTPGEFVDSLIDVTRELIRVTKPSGSIWINLGDKFNAYNGNRGEGTIQANGIRQSAPKGNGLDVKAVRPKSLIGIPWRYALACIDDLGLILRAEVIWCLSGGARVYARTSTGDRPIMLRDLVRSYRAEDVKLWNGERWTQVLGWNKTPDDDGALELELRTGERVGCTPGHKWPTQRGVIRADEIRVGDVIQTTRLPEPEQPRTPALLPDEDIGWLIGLYIAEGSRSEQMIQFSGHVNETARHARLTRIAAALDGKCAVYQTSENGATCNLSGSVIRGVLDRYIAGRTAKDKRLRVTAWQRSDAFLAAVVDGYLSGDGHFDAKNNRWRLGFTANDEWAADLRTLAARLGAKVSLRRALHQYRSARFPGWRGEWRWVRPVHHNAKQDGQVVAIRASRARDFYDLGVEDDPHLFALASGLLTHNSKPNGLPESVTDRVRRSHEQWFHFVLNPRYFSAVDEIREPQDPANIAHHARYAGRYGRADEAQPAGNGHATNFAWNPLGKLPGSVWTIPTEPLTVPDHLGVDHFAAFPSEWPKRIISGWSPAGVCVACGDGRRPVTLAQRTLDGEPVDLGGWTRGGVQEVTAGVGNWRFGTDRIITGYACACPEPTAPTTPAVVVDVFGGTGTTAMVAKALGRTGISIDMSADYCRLARWRTNDLDQLAKAQGIKRSDAARAADNLDMDSLFDLDGGAA